MCDSPVPGASTHLSGDKGQCADRAVVEEESLLLNGFQVLPSTDKCLNLT